MKGRVLRLSDVRYTWPGRTEFSITLPELTIMKGETVLLLGESGSGKSTLLSLICGTVTPDTGIVSIEETDLSHLSNAAKDRFRAEKIGVIFQQFNLLPFGTVADNIQLPLYFAPERRNRVADKTAETVTLCDALGLPAGINTAKAHTLSVGQQQRVAVARALIGHPPLILADEPTSSLDANSQSAFIDLLFKQTVQHQTSLLMVSHDPRIGERFDRVLHMEEIADVKRTSL